MKISMILAISIAMLFVISACTYSGYQSTGAPPQSGNQKYVGGGCGVASPAEGNIGELPEDQPGLAAAL